MVKLLLSTTRGNSGNRFFPHQGYLGLTPVRVEGIVRTKLEEDGRPVPAKSLSISIRCYQSRLTRSRSVRSTLVVDHTDVLWVKPPNKEYADVGELELPFKLTLPKRTPGFSTANYQDYRVFWRLEAILDHAPFPAVGSRIVRYYDLALVRYDLPPSIHLPLPGHALNHTTNKPRAPVVRYNVFAPTTPVGPSDIIHATLLLQPVDPSVAIRSATVSIERRIELHNTPAAPTPLVTAGINHVGAASLSPIATFSSVSPTPSMYPDEDAPTPTTSRFKRGSRSNPQSPYGPGPWGSSQSALDSVTTVFSSSSTFPLLSPSSPPPSPSPSSVSASPIVSSVPSTSDDILKTLTMTLTTADVTSFTCDSSGVWVKSVGLQWPENRSNSRWAVGETMQSDFASVRFYLRTRVIVAGPSGSETLDLDAREITVVPTSEADRKVAMERWAEQKELSLRSKSKSPWRKRGEDGSGADSKMNGHGLPSPPQTPAQSSDGGDHRQSTHSERDRERKSRKKVPRRPHTSAGPSDKSSFSFATNAAVVLGRSDRDRPEPLSHTSSRDSASSSHSGNSSHTRIKDSGLGESMLNADEREWREKVKAKTSGLDLKLGAPVADVRAWEDILAHVETQSQRNSVGILGVLGMSRKRTAR
ncbi:hypothetical protein DICSQDRAFT_96969 [Dichomitus squalens LYAD-421 SS1]|uniref:uncharacterized protein n=1 Tax=Dichomitus squalens (strain LYAD-421) TaxID=732165 RepID=UPI00044142C2|nr:uncharacterized protein DICSQDRAFT_96969 [Dichomitus squalens LYAD-421 SS1]EJF65635.1 hypothetical protein DICSQDRAFT_96969 [Dichomitus squalens LYAD-421 SS1]